MLEAAVAGERVTKIIQRTEQMIKQRAFLREERRRIRVAAERVDDRKCNLGNVTITIIINLY